MSSPRPLPRTPWLRVFSRRTTWWVLGAVTPIAIYALVLKAQRLARAPRSWPDIVELVASDVAMLGMWFATSLGLRAALAGSRRELPASIVLQAGLLGYVVVLLGAHGYFMSTGGSLDLSTLTAALGRVDDTWQVIASAGSVVRWAGFAALCVGVLLLPWLLARRAGPEPVVRGSSRAIGALLSFSVAGMALAFALTTTHRGASELARDPLAQLVATAGSSADAESDPVILERARHHPRGPKKLVRRAGSVARNLVIILLESTSASATSLYGDPHPTTPFLAELAARARVAERAYTVVPHTSKALVASLCGLPPRPGVQIVEALDGAIPGKCLPELLAAQGYKTALMQSAMRHFENRTALAKNLGFEQLVSGDQLDHSGLEKANYFGYEDRILLAPTRRFLAEHAGKGPLFLAYLTNTAHHEYSTPSHYGWVSFTGDLSRDRYLNAVRYQDFFVRDLFAEFERAGLLDDTVFVIAGDHGDAFGEHGLYVHDDIMYDECMRVPLLVLEPGAPPSRITEPVSQLDIAPTALDLLGFAVDDGAYPGRSLDQPAATRALYFACLTDRKCVARLVGTRKLIHSFGRKPDELYDVAVDPREHHDLAPAHPQEVAAARADALAWYRTVRALYRPGQERAASDDIRSAPPPIDHPHDIRFGDSVVYLGWSAEDGQVEPGAWLDITFHFHVLEALPEGMKLFMYAEDAQRAHSWNHMPLMRMHPESRWRGGQYLADRFHVKVPSDWLRDTLVVRGGFESPEGRLLVEPEAPRQAAVLAELAIVGRSELSEVR